MMGLALSTLSSFKEAAIGLAGLLASPQFSEFGTWNTLVQLVVFLITCNLPALLTKRMSYVDIAWPWGLVSIGVLTLLKGNSGTLRKTIIALAYLFAGLRMGLGGLQLWKAGHLQTELPRYIFQRKRWAKQGITETSGWLYDFMMQKEIMVQAAANIGILCAPAVIQGFSSNHTDLTYLEMFSWLLWFSSLAFEHTADMQKLNFAVQCKKQQLSNQVCDVGLWRYSRHPNYFGEWMVWVSLTLSSLPSLYQMLKPHLFNGGEPLEESQPVESLYVIAALSLSLVMCPVMMYWCLVYYTGAIPSEYFSGQKRPSYAQYKKCVNMFFPGPSRLN